MKGPPIFIVGAPRSGTTLLRRMLNRHPSLAICGETHFFRLIYQKRRRKAFGDLSDPANRRRLVDQYVSLRPTQQLGMDCAKLAETLYQEAASYPAMFGSVMSYYAESQGKQRCGEKTPMHAFAVGTLCEWFPGAFILHIVRDPRDVVSSLLRMPFGSHSVVMNARTWVGRNVAARRASHHDHYLQVSYEALVTDPERELTKICQFVDEEYSPSMLTPEKASVTHPAEMDRPQTPLTRSRIGQWRRELSPRQAALVEWVAGRHLEAFGYAREAPAASTTTILGGITGAALSSAQQNISKLPALWRYFLAPQEIAEYESTARRKMWAAEEQGARTRPR